MQHFAKLIKRSKIHIASMLLFVFLLLTDKLTKGIVLSYFSYYSVVEVLPFFNIVFVLNKGVSFGIFSSLSNQKWPLLILTLLISIWVAYSYVKSRSSLEKIAFAAILSGAFGNMSDRLFLGGVVDFLDFYLQFGNKVYHWPAFNIADSAIFVGVCLMLLDAYKKYKAKNY